MPRRAAPGDIARIRASLTPVLRQALVELEEWLDLHDPLATPVGQVFAQAAVVLEAARLVAEESVAPTAALERAAAYLGLERSTVFNRARRWSRPVHYGQEPPPRSVRNLVEQAADHLPEDESD